MEAGEAHVEHEDTPEDTADGLRDVAARALSLGSGAVGESVSEWQSLGCGEIHTLRRAPYPGMRMLLGQSQTECQGTCRGQACQE